MLRGTMICIRAYTIDSNPTFNSLGVELVQRLPLAILAEPRPGPIADLDLCSRGWYEDGPSAAPPRTTQAFSTPQLLQTAFSSRVDLCSVGQNRAVCFRHACSQRRSGRGHQGRDQLTRFWLHPQRNRLVEADSGPNRPPYSNSSSSTPFVAPAAQAPASPAA